MKIFIAILLACLPLQVFADDNISKRLNHEFHSLYDTVMTLEPEYMVGGLMHGKKVGDHEILWSLKEGPKDYDIIRIFRQKNERESLDISFFRSPYIVEGRTVIRRFVGPSAGAWRNDTIDADSGEYLGSQGARRPTLDERDREILKLWGIQLFE